MAYRIAAMSDAELIDRLGGDTKLAKLLNLEPYGPQRVHNWRKRGIPAEIKLKFAAVFLSAYMEASAETPNKTAA